MIKVKNWQRKIMKLSNSPKQSSNESYFRLFAKMFDLKSLILRFGLKSRQLDVRHPCGTTCYSPCSFLRKFLGQQNSSARWRPSCLKDRMLEINFS